MDSKLQSGTSDKLNWYKNHSLSESERKKLIEDKLSRAMKYKLAMAKAAKKK